MKYRIEFTSFTPGDKAGGMPGINIIEAKDDESAINQYKEFKKGTKGQKHTHNIW